jgi:hypothetical protein
MAERVGFEPTVPFSTHAFQACALSRSAISPDHFCCSLERVARPLPKSGGEGGIRTLDGLPHTPLAGERLQPLGHLSGRGKIPRFSGQGEKPAKEVYRAPGNRVAALESGGEGGIRTLEGLAPLAVFKFSSMGSPARAQLHSYRQ